MIFLSLMHRDKQMCNSIIVLNNLQAFPLHRLTHSHRLTLRFLFTRTEQSQRTLIIYWIYSNITNRMQNNSSQYAQHTPQHHQKASFAFYPHIVVLFSTGLSCLEGSVNEFQTISGIEIYWQNSDEPALPSCPAAWLSLSRVFRAYAIELRCLLDSKGWFNYINCLMTEERAAGPCMLVCDKRETLLCRGPHYASLTVT